MKSIREFVGEALGTFILVFFGCGVVAVSVLFDAMQGLLQIAFVFGTGVTLAIYATRHLSCAHLNPAVSLAMAASGRMSARKLPAYLAGQFLGAFFAALVLYALFSPSIASFEQSGGIVRGSADSVLTARMFGEYYQIPGSSAVVSLPLAMGAEALGTFVLVLIIFALTEGCNVGRPDNNMTPLFVGLTVTAIICVLAPLTQAGLNPARDFSPRLVAWLFGWGRAAFPDGIGGFFWVYMLAPVLGGQAAALLFTRGLQRLFKGATEACGCGCANVESGGDVQ